MEEYKGYRIEVRQEEYPIDPRKEFDHLGTIISLHSRYCLGEKHSFASSAEILSHLQEISAYWLPVYLYDHSGITISTKPYTCPWDSGQIGVIYVSWEKAKAEFGPCPKRKALKCLESEIREYDDYLTGNVYGYCIIDNEGNEIDSCWGYYGNPEESGLLQAAKESIDYIIENQLKNEGIQLSLAFNS
jgi:hypothetical protein